MPFYFGDRSRCHCDLFVSLLPSYHKHVVARLRATCFTRRVAASPTHSPSTHPSLGEVAAVFIKLGLTSFGGPIAHLGYLRVECVEKRKWVDETEYADLVALCQFLPGPTSSQVVFALGMRRAGFAGAFLASLGFLLPSAIAMIAFAYGVAQLGDLHSQGWLHGLKLAAVAVVAQAVWGMGVKLCPDKPRISLCLAGAAALLFFPGAYTQIAVLVGGAVAGFWLYRDLPSPSPSTSTHSTQPAQSSPSSARPSRPTTIPGWLRITAIFCLVLFFALLAFGPSAATVTQNHHLTFFNALYRPGALVFGGGHVVLPLLREGLVPAGFVTDDTFLAGYGAAQAVPGPLFSFAGYLGAAVYKGPNAWVGGLFGLFAIFLPCWLLVAGAAPFWNQLRKKAWMQASLRGANAAVVGILLAALYTPVFTQGVKSPKDLAAAFVLFGLLESWKVPPWLVVLLGAAAGQWVLS
ncbi:MAG: chromate efflux transporter [Polyangiaceae bacterium]|nr:chromate efflux transporter [Polyangiaceae bacterium]